MIDDIRMEMRTAGEERAIGGDGRSPRGTFVVEPWHACTLYNRIRSTDNSACTRIALFAPFQVQPVRLPIVKFKRQIARGRCPLRYRNRSTKPRILRFRDLSAAIAQASPRYDYDSRGERLKFIIYPWGEYINIYKRFCLLILINGYVKLTIIDCWNIWNEKVKDVEMNSQFSPAFTFKSRPTHGTLIFLPLQSLLFQ